jgi:hypothetical protein
MSGTSNFVQSYHRPAAIAHRQADTKAAPENQRRIGLFAAAGLLAGHGQCV